MFTLIAVYFIIVCSLLYISYTHKFFAIYTVLKAGAGVCFVALAVCNIRALDISKAVMLAAICACLLGDIFLGLANNIKRHFSKLFILGVCVFAIAHILFCVAFGIMSGINFLCISFSLLAFCAAYKLSSQKHFRLAKMKVPVLIYTLFVGLMCAMGANVFFAEQTTSTLLIAVGSVLFLISDFSILFLYFTIRKPHAFVRVFNLFTYYTALLCLALSL